LDEQGLVATLLSSWNTLAPEAQELARLLSLTRSAPIPWELIEHCAPPNTPQNDNRYWHDALEDLESATLLERLESERPLYGLHSMVRQFFSLQRQGWEYEPHWKRELAIASKALAEQWQDNCPVFASGYYTQLLFQKPNDPGAEVGLGVALGKIAIEAMRKQGMPVGRVVFGNVDISQLNGAEALAAVMTSLGIQEESECRDSINIQSLRELFLSHTNEGDARVAQGDWAGALSAYLTGLSVAKRIAHSYPLSTEGKVKIILSYLKLGSMEEGLQIVSRRAYLQNGLNMLRNLKQVGQLPPGQDCTALFEQEMRKLDSPI
jgi:hypothetical protein